LGRNVWKVRTRGQTSSLSPLASLKSAPGTARSKLSNNKLPAIPGKRYFATGEVTELCAVKAYVQSHWGQEFPQRVFLYILLEFQSKVDSTMPLRLMHYVACFYDHLLKTRETKPRQGLPPIFPIVLYNGSKRWSARQDIYEMIQSRGRI
jgi:hypothetical protein